MYEVQLNVGFRAMGVAKGATEYFCWLNDL